jgi:uncharacterized protein YbjT (DUF2867 family)
MTPTEKPTLVLGANGKTGRRIVDRLRARDVAVRAGSRSEQPPFDWEDPATWRGALGGVSAAYISYFPDLAVRGAPEAVGAFAEQAMDAGVDRLVLLSGRGEEEAQRSEEVLRRSGASWTIVRASWFAQNFNESYFVDPIRAGEVALPTDGVGEPFIDASDIADVAVAALTEEGHVGQLYEVTGPRLLTFAEAIGEIAKATGRELRYVPVGFDEFDAGLAAEGAPADVVELLRYLFGEVLDGRNAHLADGVQRALGREPRDFTDFAREAATTGVWDV